MEPTGTQLSPATKPSWRLNTTMTYDPVRKQIMMFGGDGTGTGPLGILNDIWIWTGANWVLLGPVPLPEGRVDGNAAYDAVLQQIVLFSGLSSSGPANLPNEVWLWDGARWKQQSQNPSPAPEFGGSMAYDEVRQQVVLFGGARGTSSVELRSGETWIYANNAVQQFVNLSITANPAGAGTFAVSAQGQTGPSYRTGSEISITATPASSAADFEFWTGACAGASNPCPLRLIADTAVTGNFLAPSKWIQLGPANRPMQRDLAGAAFDTVRGELVLFGGATADDNEAGVEIMNNETWTWDGTNWTQKAPSTSPSGREAFAMAYDPVHQQTVIFGGAIETASDPFFAIAETWIWDGTTWTQRSPATSPSPRFGARMAWDGNRIILFSGLTASGRPQETWAWDGTNWTLLSPATSPAGRAYPAMVYDAQRNQLVMFGGVASTGFLNDTWIWNGVNWTQQDPATPPEARSIAMAAYDAAIQKVVLFSGESSVTPPNASLPNEVWLWDGAQWKQESQNPSPAAEIGGAMAYDEIRQQVVLFGGGNGAAINHTRSRETWIYANNAVQQFVTLTVVANPAAVGAVTGSGTYRTGQTVAVMATPAAGYEFAGWSGAGCSGNQSPCAPLLSGAGGATQTATANFRLALSWLKLNPEVSAAPNQSLFFSNPASMTYDSVRNQIVYFGGSGGTQTWIWNGTTWALRAPVHSPPARSGAALAFDQARQVVVLFGGANAAGVVMNDTWTWNGTDWTQMSTPVSPPVRANHSMAYDSLHQETVLFGGWNEDPVDGFVFRTDTWVWNGSAWIQRTPFFAPPGRSDFGMAYDPVNQQVVITTGFEGTGDTWTWDGTSWQFAAPLPDGSFRAMAYDQLAQRLVLVSEADGNIFKTSVWDGVEWIPLAPLQSPPARLGAGLAYDGVRGEVLLFGGYSAVSGAALSDTWVLAPPAVILTPLSFTAVKNASGYLVTTVLANAGNANANTVFALDATLGTVSSFTFTSTQFITIAPGSSANIIAQFPASAGPGAKAFSITGGFSVDGSAGTWSAAARSVTLP